MECRCHCLFHKWAKKGVPYSCHFIVIFGDSINLTWPARGALASTSNDILAHCRNAATHPRVRRLSREIKKIKSECPRIRPKIINALLPPSRILLGIVFSLTLCGTVCWQFCWVREARRDVANAEGVLLSYRSSAMGAFNCFRSSSSSEKGFFRLLDVSDYCASLS